MQINIRFISIAVFSLIGSGWFIYDRYIPHFSSEVTNTVVTTNVPVVMRTPGGLLEIATVRVYEKFTRDDPLVFGNKEFGAISFGTTTSQIQAAVTYRYHIEMQKEWLIKIEGKICIVRASEVKPTIPVAFDSTTVQKYTHSGWARFNKSENLTLLEKSLTPVLQARAMNYRQLAADAGRKTVAEFVTRWLVKEQNWKRDPSYRVIVLFPEESLQQ